MDFEHRFFWKYFIVQISIYICSYNAKEGDGKESNMALLEVSLPSGYTTGKEFFADLLETAGVKKVETKNGDTVVVIYFGSLSEKEVRVTIIGFQRHKVEEPKPASIVLYDYYDSCQYHNYVIDSEESFLELIIHLLSFLQRGLLSTFTAFHTTFNR